MQDTSPYPFSNRLIQLSLFFIPALLLSTKNGSVFIIALLALYSIGFIIKSREKISFTKFDGLVVLFLGAYTLANIPVYSVDPDNFRYFKGASRFLGIIPIYFMVKTTLQRTEKVKPFLDWGIVIGAIGAIVIALYQVYVEGRPRVDGFLYSINFGYLACALSFLALNQAKKSHIKLLLYLAFLLSSYATLLTLTRGAMFVLPILLLLSLIFYHHEKRVLRCTITIVGIAIISLVLFTTSPSVKQRIEFTKNEFINISSGNINKAESSGTRIQLWYAASQAFLERPLMGLTHQERDKLNMKLFQEGKIGEFPTTISRGHAHNQYFEMLASNGIWGIIALALMLGFPLIFFFKHINHSDSAYTGFIFVSGFILYCLTEVPLEQNLISSFYAFFVVFLITSTRVELRNHHA